MSKKSAKTPAVKISVHGPDKEAARKAAEQARKTGKYSKVIFSAQREGYTVYGVKK